MFFNHKRIKNRFENRMSSYYCLDVEYRLDVELLYEIRQINGTEVNNVLLTLDD